MRGDSFSERWAIGWQARPAAGSAAWAAAQRSPSALSRERVVVRPTKSPAPHWITAPRHRRACRVRSRRSRTTGSHRMIDPSIFGEDDPVWYDPDAARAAGFAGVPAPPTVSVLLAHWRDGGVAGMVDAVGAD